MIIPLKTRFLDLSEEEFFLFCQDLPDVHIEREADGTIVVGLRKEAAVSNLSAEITTDLVQWNRSRPSGLAFGPHTGFTLPNQAVKSPDTAWVAIERWRALPKEDRKRFAHLSPDFVIEIRSENDTVERLQAKMQEYQANGVRLGWLIDPQQAQVWIYRADGTISKVDSFATPLSGEEVLPGFSLNLAELWEPEG